MQICRALLFSFICFGLQACVSPKMSQEVQLGKSHYVAGNYKQAFHSLLPAAVCGNLQAQYAVGYMYYYGYGVAQDSESGLFWMHRAASQGYGPAIKALAIIQQGPQPYGPCPGGVGCDKRVRIYKGETDAVIRTLDPRAVNSVQIPHLKRTYTSYLKNVHPKVTPQTVEAPMSPKVVIKKNNEPQKIKKVAELTQSTSANQYALQLFGAYQIESVKNLQSELELEKNTHIWHTQNKGKDWYVLTYGKYASVAQARVGQTKLSEDVNNLGPWVRKLNGLEAVV